MSLPSQILAQRRGVRIEHCGSCDALHVTVGPVTLRIQPGVAQSLRDALSDALECMPAQSSSPAMVLSALGELSH